VGKTMRIVFLLADQMMCDGLRALLGQDPAAEVVGQTEDGPKALELIRQLQPDLVLADLSSWASGSFDAVQQITRELPDTKVIALSTFVNRTFVAEAFRRGVRGYVLKQDGFGELLQAVRTVMAGSTYLCSRATQGILDLTLPMSTKPGDMSGNTLTDRECIILQMLSEGKSSKEIALSLEISSKTIDACRRQLMRKLSVDSLAGLVKQALLLGLTTLSA